MQRGIGEQVEEFGQILGQTAGADRDGIQAAARLDAGADEIGFFGELRGGAPGGAAVEQGRHGVGEAGPRAVERVARLHEQAEGDGGFTVVFDDENFQAVGQDDLFVVGETGLRFRQGRGRMGAVDVGAECERRGGEETDRGGEDQTCGVEWHGGKK